jgi:DnaJ-class molecular chaperone
MTTDPRLEALVEKAALEFDETRPYGNLLRHMLRSILAEALEAGAWVTCERCKGNGGGWNEEEGMEWECDDCRTQGRIRRELAGALWGADRVAEYFCAEGRDAERSIRNRAYKKWGEKEKSG